MHVVIAMYCVNLGHFAFNESGGNLLSKKEYDYALRTRYTGRSLHSPCVDVLSLDIYDEDQEKHDYA
jgi:hypothetical protein